MAPALVITLMILGWSAAAAAMLWGILRTARYHHRHGTRRDDEAGYRPSGDQFAKSSKELQLQEYNA